MPPKKGKKGKRGTQIEVPVPEPEVQMVFSEESVLDHDFDYRVDINESFFAAANKVIQKLVEANRTAEATKVKKYVEIVHSLHRHYVNEVQENEILRPQVIVAANKLRLALELTSDCEDAVQKFREALRDAWRETDASLLREMDTQERMHQVMIKVESLEKKNVKSEGDDTAEYGNLGKYKNIILRERDKLNHEVNDLEKRLLLHRYYSESLEYLNKNLEESLNSVLFQLKVLNADKQNIEVRNRNLINNLADQKQTSSVLKYKLEATAYELRDTVDKLDNMAAANEHQKFQIGKLKDSNTNYAKEMAKYEEEFYWLRKTQRENEETIRTLRLEDRVKAANIVQLTNKHKLAVKDHDIISSKLYKQNRDNHALQQEIGRLKNTISSLEQDIQVAGQKWEDMYRQKESVQRDRDTLAGEIAKLNNDISDMKHAMAMQSNNISNLRVTIAKLHIKLDEAKINIGKAEKERDDMAQEVTTLDERIEYLEDELKFKGELVIDLTDKIAKKHAQLFKANKQLEAFYSERILLKRKLDTTAQECDDFRALQLKTAHQICQMTEDITDGHKKITALNLKIERLINEKKEVLTELKSTERMLASVRSDLKGLKAENETLMKTIADDEKKFMKLTTELQETRKEKNLIGLQMVRRNDEIVTLKDKFRIMQTALDNGQTQYNERIEDIRLLKTEVKNLHTERTTLKRAIDGTADMRFEIVRLNRMLNEERIKGRALMDDAKIPTAVHRWRILRGVDPARYDLIRKVQLLQKRSLKHAIEQTNMKEALAEKQRLCDNLKKVIDDMPSNDIKKKLVVFQRRTREQMNELKALRAEVIIDKVELKDRECTIEELKKSLKTAKIDCQVGVNQSTQET